MKKLLIKFLLTVIVFVLLAPFVPVKANNSPAADQVVMPDYYVQGGWKYYTETVGYDVCQEFYPSKTQLAYFDLALTNTNPDAGSTWADIRTNGMLHRPATVLNTYHQTSYVNYEDSRTMAHMDPQNAQEITLDTSKGYWICVTHLPQNAKLYYNDPTDYSGSLITGYSSATTFHTTQSFGFRTYGYNPEVATPPADNNVAPSGNATTTPTTTGTAPSTNTSTSISAPTSVAATYTSANQGVSVTWTASKTTDITGYNIYRTTTAGENYTKVGTVAKNFLQYVDGTVSKSTSYYYMVRAYKTTTESINSNEAKVDVPADAVVTATTTVTPITPEVPTYNKKYEITTLVWAGLGVAVLLIALLVYLIVKRRKKSKPTVK